MGMNFGPTIVNHCNTVRLPALPIRSLRARAFLTARPCAARLLTEEQRDEARSIVRKIYCPAELRAMPAMDGSEREPESYGWAALSILFVAILVACSLRVAGLL